MYFCDKCNTLCAEDACPHCGNRQLRAPEFDDFCFLTERAPMWADMLRAALQDTGIESAYQPLMGTGTMLGAGRSLDRHQIFVPYDCYDAAQAVMMALFGETLPGRSPASVWRR